MVMAVITLFAPATRIGYLLYPINFFVWAHLFSTDPADPRMPAAELARAVTLAVACRRRDAA